MVIALCSVKAITLVALTPNLLLHLTHQQKMWELTTKTLLFEVPKLVKLFQNDANVLVLSTKNVILFLQTITKYLIIKCSFCQQMEKKH